MLVLSVVVLNKNLLLVTSIVSILLFLSLFGCPGTQTNTNNGNVISSTNNGLGNPDATQSTNPVNNDLGGSISEISIPAEPKFNNYCDTVLDSTDLQNLCSYSKENINFDHYLAAYSADPSINFKNANSFCTHVIALGKVELLNNILYYPNESIQVKVYVYDSQTQASSEFEKGTDYVSQYVTETVSLGDKAFFNKQNNASNDYLDILVGNKWIQLHSYGASCLKTDLTGLAQKIINNLS